MGKYVYLLLSLFLLFSAPAFAQQKVRDNTMRGKVLPVKDALLELESTNKGFLLTRVQLKSLHDASPMSEHVAGMMVYNTATANDVVPGIYFNDGTKWVSAETLTTIAVNPDSVHVDYVDEAGNTTQLDMTAVVQKLETLTTLVGNADGTFTYTDEHGDPHDI